MSAKENSGSPPGISSGQGRDETTKSSDFSIRAFNVIYITVKSRKEENNSLSKIYQRVYHYIYQKTIVFLDDRSVLIFIGNTLMQTKLKY